MIAKTVQKVALTNDAKLQRRLIRQSAPEFSHNAYLPLDVDIRPSKSWWCRNRINVKTREEVWYRDLLVNIKLPKGRRSDLGSVPALVWWLISPWDIALESLFHDEGYRVQPAGIERREWDNLLLKMMRLRKKPFVVRWIVYAGVRVGGHHAWEENRKRKVRREKNKP